MPMEPHLNPREPFGSLSNLAGLLISHTMRWRIGDLGDETSRTPSLHLHVRHSIVPNGPKQGPKSPRNGPFDTFVPRRAKRTRNRIGRHVPPHTPLLVTLPCKDVAGCLAPSAGPATPGHVRSHRCYSVTIEKSTTGGAQWQHAPKQRQTKSASMPRPPPTPTPRIQPRDAVLQVCSPLWVWDSGKHGG